MIVNKAWEVYAGAQGALKASAATSAPAPTTNAPRLPPAIALRNFAAS